MIQAVLLFLCVCVCQWGVAEEQPPHHMRVDARYTTPEGIGFNTGYTTLEGFFTTRFSCDDSWRPFLDLRGHAFDNGKFAANAGGGFRYLSGSRLWGLNAYYDYRNAKRQHYNQVAAGVECLGRVWDFRLNGYLPVGAKESPHYHTHSQFQRSHLLIHYSRAFAMKGANAEVGAHVNMESTPLYFAAGPYYLTSEHKTTWGGELRARIEFAYRYVRIEGMAAYDHFFKWIGQAQISVNVPFGPRIKTQDRSCIPLLDQRSVQPVDRFEIIPQGKFRAVTRAIDPATGKPWVF